MSSVFVFLPSCLIKSEAHLHVYCHYSVIIIVVGYDAECFNNSLLRLCSPSFCIFAVDIIYAKMILIGIP